MGRLLKYLVFLALLVSIGILAYAYLGDMSAPQTEVNVPVEPK